MANTRTKAKEVVINVMLVIASIVSFVALFEFVILRYVIVAPDFPTKFVTVDNVVRYVPGQHGVKVDRDMQHITFSINAQGWNSSHPAYALERSPGKKLIAIIGDSFIEGLSVDVDKHFGELIENDLKDSEVYRFGIGGIGISQFQNILENEVVKYKPDTVVVNVFQDDFRRSYYATESMYSRYSMKYSIGSDGTVTEVAPIVFNVPWYEGFRHSAIWRFLRYRMNVDFSAIKRLFFSIDKDSDVGVGASEAATDSYKDVAVADHFISVATKLSSKLGFRLIMVIDGDRERIYKNKDIEDYTKGNLRLNTVLKDACARYGVDFIDLHPSFVQDFQEHHKQFDTVHDYHWNEYGNKVAADAILKYMKEHNLQ